MRPVVYFPTVNYPDELSVQEARELYFSNSGFTADTYTDRWVRLPVFGFHIYLPNFAGRRRAVPLHDIDHILTEYRTDWRGEWQISAYEIGTGCGRYWAGWMINLQAILMGAVLAPAESIHAFARGRRSGGIYTYAGHEPLLAQKVGDLRKLTTLPRRESKPGVTDAILFYGIAFCSFAVHVLPLALLVHIFS